MSLIIGPNGIAKLKLGYPTVSDKYDVDGGLYVGDDPIPFGTILKYTSVSGQYKAASDGISAESPLEVAQIAGVALATNVKLATEPGHEVFINKGEPANRLLSGYVALALPSGADLTAFGPGDPVGISLTDASIHPVGGDYVAIPGWTFTGVTDTASDGTKLAEVRIVPVAVTVEQTTEAPAGN